LRPQDNTSPFKGRKGLARLIAATRYSCYGLKAALQHEAAFRQELWVAVVLWPIALWTASSTQQALLLIGSIVAVLVVELLNSAIEALADAISLEHNPLLGRAKDLGSAAVLLTVLFATAVWAVHFYDLLTTLLSS
jgi:diacylglycerol kinase (ATP)